MISVKNIGVRFGRRDVIDDVSFDLTDGEIVALLGPNGAGKTTLIRALNSTVPISSGEIVIGGNSISTLSRREIARQIAVVAQENETKFPLTVLEFVLAGQFVHGRAFGWETEGDIENARRALADCELSDFADRLMNELSGGERQRVVLARATGDGCKRIVAGRADGKP